MTNLEEEQRLRRDGGYAWVVFLAAFFAQFAQSSVYNAYGVLMVVYTDVFEEDKTTVSVGAAIIMTVTSVTSRYDIGNDECNDGDEDADEDNNVVDDVDVKTVIIMMIMMMMG